MKTKTKVKNSKRWQGCGEIGTQGTVHGSNNGTAAMENSTAGPPKVKHRIPHDTAIPLQDTYPKEQKARSSRDMCT